MSNDTELEVSRWLVRRLIGARNPISRRQLGAELQAWAIGQEWRWSTATAVRRLREGISAARRDGFPVVSVGAGFFLARRPEDRRQAAERLRKQARAMFSEADRLEHTPVPEEMQQLELGF